MNTGKAIDVAADTADFIRRDKERNMRTLIKPYLRRKTLSVLSLRDFRPLLRLIAAKTVKLLAQRGG